MTDICRSVYCDPVVLIVQKDTCEYEIYGAHPA